MLGSPDLVAAAAQDHILRSDIETGEFLRSFQAQIPCRESKRAHLFQWTVVRNDDSCLATLWQFKCHSSCRMQIRPVSWRGSGFPRCRTEVLASHCEQESILPTCLSQKNLARTNCHRWMQQAATCHWNLLQILDDSSGTSVLHFLSATGTLHSRMHPLMMWTWSLGLCARRQSASTASGESADARNLGGFPRCRSWTVCLKQHASFFILRALASWRCNTCAFSSWSAPDMTDRGPMVVTMDSAGDRPLWQHHVNPQAENLVLQAVLLPDQAVVAAFRFAAWWHSASFQLRLALPTGCAYGLPCSLLVVSGCIWP